MAGKKGQPFGKPFEKGVSGNPGGRPKVSDALRGVVNVTNVELVKLISKYFRMNILEVLQAAESQVLPMIEVAIARCLEVTAKGGDFNKLAPLVDRVGGKVLAQTIEIDLPEPIVIVRRTGEEVVLSAKKKDEGEE